MQLFIGNQNYSSWSLRAWLIFEQFDIDVQVTKLPLFKPEFYQALTKVTPTAKVPTLVDGDVAVWESLAILEYVNEQYLAGKAWPEDSKQRAKARAIASEMHAGFTALRSELPMNCRAQRRVELSEAALKDVQRIDEMWSQQMDVYPDQWLFGDWSIVDAMYAPVVLRFKTYDVQLSKPAQAYLEKALQSPAMQAWIAEALLETDIVEEDEAGEDV